MFLAGLCVAITMSGGATIPDRRTRPTIADRRTLACLGSAGLEPLSWNIDINVSEATDAPRAEADLALFASLGSGGTGTSESVNDVASAGAAAARPRTAAPSKKGPVDRFLEDAEVNDGVQRLLAAIQETLPGYATMLEVIQDPDDPSGAACLMVSVCMSGEDQGAWDAVENLIDSHWLPLAPHVRGALGVGRELVSVG